LGWGKDDSIKQKQFYQLSFSKPIDLAVFNSLIISIAHGDLSELEKGGDEPKKKKEKDVPINFIVQLEDSLGQQVHVELNSIKKLAPRLKVQFEKLNLLQEEYGSTWEPTFETLEIPLVKFARSVTPLTNIKHIRFVFDLTRGVIIIDDIGLGKEIHR